MADRPVRVLPKSMVLTFKFVHDWIDAHVETTPGGRPHAPYFCFDGAKGITTASCCGESCMVTMTKDTADDAK